MFPIELLIASDIDAEAETCCNSSDAMSAMVADDALNNVDKFQAVADPVTATEYDSDQGKDIQIVWYSITL